MSTRNEPSSGSRAMSLPVSTRTMKGSWLGRTRLDSLLESLSPGQHGNAVAIGHAFRQHWLCCGEALIIVAVEAHSRFGDGHPLVERGDPDQGVVGPELGVNLEGSHFREEIPIGPAAGHARLVVRLVEVAVAVHRQRGGVRLEVSRDDAGMTFQQIADPGGCGVRDVPGAIDGLIEVEVRSRCPRR